MDKERSKFVKAIQEANVNDQVVDVSEMTVDGKGWFRIPKPKTAKRICSRRNPRLRYS